MLRLFLASFLFGAAMLIVAAIPNARAADDVLDGWEKYKFGMTIEQVRAVPGIAWSETKTEEIGAMKFTWLEATAPVKFGLRAYNLRIDFKPDIGLQRIGFEDKTAATSTGSCERRFTGALATLEQRHGAFVARSPVGTTDTPFGTNDMRRRNAPTGKSTYNYLVATMQFEPKGPVHTSIESSVFLRSGNKSLSIRAISPDATSCTVAFDYGVDVP